MTPATRDRSGISRPTKLDARARPEDGAARLDHVTLACIAFRELSLDGRRYLEALGIDCEGAIVALAARREARRGADQRVALFASLLARGLRANRPTLVDHAGCSMLRGRIAAAWGRLAVFLG